MNSTNIENKVIVTQVIGYVATIVTSGLFIPQIIHMVQNKSGKDVSYIFLALNLLCSLLWIIYAFLINEYPLIVCDAIIGILTIIMMILKSYYEKDKH